MPADGRRGGPEVGRSGPGARTARFEVSPRRRLEGSRALSELPEQLEIEGTRAIGLLAQLGDQLVADRVRVSLRLLAPHAQNDSTAGAKVDMAPARRGRRDPGPEGDGSLERGPVLAEMALERERPLPSGRRHDNRGAVDARSDQRLHGTQRRREGQPLSPLDRRRGHGVGLRMPGREQGQARGDVVASQQEKRRCNAFFFNDF